MKRRHHPGLLFSPIRSLILNVIASPIAPGGGGGVTPTGNANAQLVWNAPPKSGFMYWYRYF